jgi:hypothetical protein
MPGIDEQGWYLSLGAGPYRFVDAAKFYLALADHGIRARLWQAKAISAMLSGQDHIGIVPDYCLPIYCHGFFRDVDKEIETFMRLPEEHAKEVQEKAEWLPLKNLTLQDTSNG